MKRESNGVELITCVNCSIDFPLLAAVMTKGNYFCTALCSQIFDQRQLIIEKGRKK